MIKQYYSIAELAKILGVSRITVYKKVKRGAIKSSKMGKSYFIPASYVNNIIGKTLSETSKNQIDLSVMKTIKEYGEVLKKLGKE